MKTYTMKRRDGQSVRVTVPASDDSIAHRLEAFDMMRDALRALIETDLHDAGNFHRAKVALAAADRAAEIE